MAVPVAPYAVGSGAGTPDNPWSQVTNPATGKTFYTPSDQVQAYYEQYSSLGYPTPAAPSQPAPSQESLWVTNPDLAYQLYQQGLPAALEGYDIQMPQPTAPGSALPGYIVQPTPAPAPQVIQQPVVVQEVTGSPLSIMAPFKTGDGYDLIAAMQAAVNEPQIRQVAMQYFEPEVVQYAEYAAKPALDVEQWAKLSPERQQFLRPVRDADIIEYSRMSDFEKLGVRNIIPVKMSLAEYEKMGKRFEGTGLIAAEPSGWVEQLKNFPNTITEKIGEQVDKAKVFYSEAPLPPGIKQATQFAVAVGVTAGMGLVMLPLLPAQAIQNPGKVVGGLKDFVVNAAKGTAKGDPWAIGEMLVIVAPIAKPLGLGLIRGIKHGGMATSALAGGGILPSALKTGRISSIDISVPKIFDRMKYEVEAITKDQAVYNAIFKSGLSKSQQIAEVGKRLNPETKVVYDWYMKLIDEASDYRMPVEMIRDVNLAEIDSIPQVSASALKQTLWTKYKGDIEIHGSFADWLQTKGINGAKSAADMDINITTKSKLTVPELQKALLDDIINTYGKDMARIRGAAIEIKIKGKWTKALDVHKEGTFGEMAYQWEPKAPVNIEGVRIQSLNEQIYRRGEQIVNPGIGKARGLIGPKAAGREWRVKDYQRFDTAITAIAEGQRILAKEVGGERYLERASRLEAVLDAIHGLPRGKPLPIEWGEGQYWQGEFLGLVGEMQKASIESPLAGGKAGRYASLDPFLEHKAGTLERNLSPSARVMPNVVYSCTTNLKLWVDTILQKQAEALKSGKPVDRSITVGGKMYDIKTQQWLDAPGQIMFTSPDAAFNYLFEITGGKIPKDAGIVAIRIAGKDIGTVVSPASRITYDVARKGIIKKEFVAKAKVLDEMTIQRNTKLYATKPNEFSKGGVSIGEIGETWTYEPRTMQRIPVVWLATKAASDAGYGAPSLAKIRIMNRMAIWNSVVNLLDPHLPKKISIKWESAKELPSEGFIQFYREKWRWQSKEGNTLREFVAKENDAYINEIKRTIKKEDYKTSAEYDNAMLDRIAKDMADDYKRAADDSKVREVLRDKGELERFNNEYVISLKKLAQDLVPKVVQQTPKEIEAEQQAVVDKALAEMKEEALKERKDIAEAGKEDITGKERIEEVPGGEAPEELPGKPPGETEVTEVPPEEPTIEEPIEEPPEEPPPEEPGETPIEETPLELLEETAIAETPPGKVPPIIPLIVEGGEAKRGLGAYEGAIGWQQGELKSGKVFHIYKKPWRQENYEIVVADEPPEGMRLFPSATKAIETLQVLTGEFPGERDIDIGAFQLQIKGTRQLKGRYVRRGGNTPMADVSAKEAKVTVVS